MPSPFPGMDPYLEAPHIWPDLHDALAAEMRSELNQTLPSPYYVRLEMRPALGTGPYRRGAVDYASEPPEPPLAKEDAAWAAELTRPWRERAPAGPHSVA